MAVMLLIFLLLLFFVPSAVLAELLNIDCGAAAGYTDAATDLTWVGDGGYVRGGQSYNVSIPAGLSKDFATLRAFPGSRRKKNCYTIDVGTDTKIQLTMFFYYGNYDGLSKPPSFDLTIDSNYWYTVDTSVAPLVNQYAIYVTSRKETNICLCMLKDDEVPLVSSIHVRTLEPFMYGLITSDYSLYAPYRYAFGINDSLGIRYPDDPYYRRWIPPNSDLPITTDYQILESNLTSVDTSTSFDKPPAKMFRRAIAAKGESQNLTAMTAFLPSKPSASTVLYLNLYFSEMSTLNLSERREFNVYIDDQLRLGAKTIRPPLGSALEFSTLYSNATSNTSITLVPTANSTLPPVISGFEALLVWRFTNQWTASGDVKALSLLQAGFPVLENWTGDPCLPVGYIWEWLNCSSDNSPRITKLYLAGFGLSGEIPDFSALDALVAIDLQHNNLTGTIPEFLGTFPKLQTLNLAYNDFSSIPSALTKRTELLLNVTGNPKLCQAGEICINGLRFPTATPPSTPASSTGRKISFEGPSRVPTWFKVLAIVAIIFV